ncbi:MAG: ribbon-helix-helix domain-containing protein [Candidatus Woesearchaeota archaeon]
MATEMITLKMNDSFLKEIDTIVEKQGYQNRTEFIRNALREKMEDAKMKEAMRQLANMKGASRKKSSDKELDLIRDKVFKELE